MKMNLLKIVSAALAGVMLMTTAIPAMAAEGSIAVIDLASAPMVISEGTPQDYPDPDGKDITINIIGAGDKRTIDTSSLVPGNFAQIRAESTIDNKYNFSHYEYVTTARNYVASYDQDFTFYVDPPMEINVVYAEGEPAISGKGLVSGMYKDPEVKGSDTYFYCAVAGAKGEVTTADITFGRSQKDESNAENAETFQTGTEQNIYDETDTAERGSFQYVVSSAIQTGGPIDFEAKVSAATTNALIKTWDLKSGAFYGVTDGEVNGLTVNGNTYTFTANIDDKVRVYASSKPTITGVDELQSANDIYEYVVAGPVTITGDNINKIMVNPMDIVIADGQEVPDKPAATTGTIKVTIENNLDNSKVTNAVIKASNTDIEGFEFTVPEIDTGIYSISAPNGRYNITAEYNGETISSESPLTITDNNTVEVTLIYDAIHAEAKEKLEKLSTTLIDTKVNPYNAPIWNTESGKSGVMIWHYVNGAMMSAFLDIYEADAVNNEKFKDYVVNFTDPYISSSNTIDITKLKDYKSGKANDSYSKSIGNKFQLDGVKQASDLYRLTKITGDEKYAKTAANIFKDIFVTYDTDTFKITTSKDSGQTALGSYYHKNNYPAQIWLDGLYMAMPFYIQYANSLTNASEKQEAINVVYKQFENVHTYLRESEDKTSTDGKSVQNLYYHGYDGSYSGSGSTSNCKQTWSKRVENKGRSESYWLRGQAWYAMAMVDVIEHMPEGEQKNNMIAWFKEFMDAVVRWQDEETGMWRQVVDKPATSGDLENYFETTGSSGMAYALMKGARLGYLDSSYYNYGVKAFDGVCKNKLTYDTSVSNYGMTLKDMCRVAGLGGTSSTQNYDTINRDGSFEYYLKEDRCANDGKGFAPLLMAYSEVLKHDNAQ